MAEEPHLGTLHPGRALGVVLYLLLAVALAVALLGDRLGLPAALRDAAPVAFGLFLVIFALYRFTLIRAGRYPFGRALYQVGAGVMLLAVLFHRAPPAAPAQAEDLSALLESGDPLVRRLSCELARYRPGGAAVRERVKAHAEGDAEAPVREECRRSLQALAGP
jgi:hypothetical protein